MPSDSSIPVHWGDKTVRLRLETYQKLELYRQHYKKLKPKIRISRDEVINFILTQMLSKTEQPKRRNPKHDI